MKEKSLVKLIKKGHKPELKKSVKAAKKKAGFSLPIQRLADKQGLSNNYAIRRYDWTEPIDTGKKSKPTHVISSIEIEIDDIATAPKATSVSKKEKATEEKPAPTIKKEAALPPENITEKGIENQVSSVQSNPNDNLSPFASWLSTKKQNTEIPKNTTATTDSSDAEEIAIIPESTKSKKAKGKKKDSKKKKGEPSSKKKKKGNKSASLKQKIETSIKKQQGVVTETLAKLYVDQGYPKKAINAYKQLSLIYPEKSSFFALLIEDLKKKLK